MGAGSRDPRVHCSYAITPHLPSINVTALLSTKLQTMVKTNSLNNDNHNGEKSTVRSAVHPLALNRVPLGMRIEGVSG